MSCYDTIELENGTIQDQIKCWYCEMQLLSEGDKVPDVSNLHDYAIALRVGGYVIVENSKILKWVKDKPSCPIFDKWGEPFDEYTTKGLLNGIQGINDDYFYKNEGY